MRSLKSLLLLIVPCLPFLAGADQLPPSLVWTGAPDFSETGHPQGTSESATATDQGMTVQGTCSLQGLKCNADFSWDRQFTVISPGTFELSGWGTDAILADNCDSGFCSPAAVVQGSFTELGYLGLSGDGSAVDSATSCISLGCKVSLNLSDTDSLMMTLAVGNYSLSETYEGYAQGSGDISSDYKGTFNLVPTPEPRGGSVAVVLAFFVAFWLRHAKQKGPSCAAEPRFRQSTQID